VITALQQQQQHPLAGFDNVDEPAIITGEDINDQQPAGPSTGFGLRLRNFAIDPATSMGSRMGCSSSTTGGSSWHVAEGAPPPLPIIPTPQQQSHHQQEMFTSIFLPTQPAFDVSPQPLQMNILPLPTSTPIVSNRDVYRVTFPHVQEELSYCFCIPRRDNVDLATYAIITAVRSDNNHGLLKIFIPMQIVNNPSLLKKDHPGWMNAVVTFEAYPSHQFQGQRVARITLKYGTSHNTENNSTINVSCKSLPHL
jgi:hypothetical protein